MDSGFLMQTVFTTGATGFIGRRFLADRPAAWSIRALRRAKETSAETSGPTSGELAWVDGQLEDVDGFESALAGVEAVVHLGAMTGKAPPAKFTAVNRDATGALIEAAERAGVRRFVFISTIATRFPEHDRYPYGRAKKEAEALVRSSSLDWTIVRPTIVLGAGSAIYKSLVGLGRLPMTPLFGSGQTKIQPILADDVAKALWAILDDPSTIGQAIDLGGPDVLTFDEFMGKLRRQAGRTEGPLVHLPAGLTSWALGLAEPALLPVLPLTAGQLYAFRYDSTAEDSDFMARHRSGFAGIDTQLEVSASNE